MSEINLQNEANRTEIKTRQNKTNNKQTKRKLSKKGGEIRGRNRVGAVKDRVDDCTLFGLNGALKWLNWNRLQWIENVGEWIKNVE